MNIVVEGPDNSGKSTLVKYLSRVLRLPVVEGKGPPKSVEEINERVVNYSEYKNVIFDRHPAISNPIYDIARQVEPQIHPDNLKEFFFKTDKIIIFCRGDRTLDTHVVKADENPAHVQMVNDNHRLLCDLYDAWALSHADILYDKNRSSMRAVAQMIAQRFTVHTNFMEDIEEFQMKFGLFYDGPARNLTGELGTFRENFLQEEIDEYSASREAIAYMAEQPLVDRGEYTFQLDKQLDALVDLVYVALGNAQLQGFDFVTAWKRVHAANMKKVRAKVASDSKRGTAFDVVKPPGWEAPSHMDLVEVNDYEV